MRLQKFLAQAGVSSRRKAEALIASGAVRVNGVRGHDAGHQRRARKIASRSTAGASCAETPIYRLMLKPRACLATLAKSGARPDAGALRRATPSRGCRWSRRSTFPRRASCC